MQVSCIW